MPKRVIDFDAMWGSDKLAACAEWAQAEYAWLYGLADASGCFELTNLRVIWGRVAAIRRNLTIERLEQIFAEFQEKGLLFVWEHEGKRYGHWTGSDVPGRLPAPSWRVRLERLAPPVPKQKFAEYVSRFARGRAALAGGGFGEHAEPGSRKNEFETSHLKSGGGPLIQDAAVEPWRTQGNGTPRELEGGGRGDCREPIAGKHEALSSLKEGLEAAQAQDWKLKWNRDQEKRVAGREFASTPVRGQLEKLSTAIPKSLFSESNSKPEIVQDKSILEPSCDEADRRARANAAGAAVSCVAYRLRDKAAQLAGELLVGQGPLCGPVSVKPEALERVRLRDAARKGSRSP